MRLVIWISMLLAVVAGCAEDRGAGDGEGIVRAPDLTMRNSSSVYLTDASLVSGHIVEDFGVLGQNGGAATIGFAMITRNPVFDVVWQEGRGAPKQRVSFDLTEFLQTYEGKISRFEFDYQGQGVWDLNVRGPIPEEAYIGEVVRTFSARLP